MDYIHMAHFVLVEEIDYYLAFHNYFLPWLCNYIYDNIVLWGKD